MVELIIFNLRLAPFKDLAMRQAIASGIDRATLASVDGKRVAASLVPPACRAHNRDARLYALNPQMAQDLLAKNGVTPDAPIQVTLGVLTKTPPRRIELLGNALRPLGINVIEKDLDLSSTHMFYMKIGLDRSVCTNSSPIKMVHSKSPLNLGGYTSPEVDSWIDQTDASRDLAARMRLFQQAEQRVLDEAVLIPIWWE